MGFLDKEVAKSVEENEQPQGSAVDPIKGSFPTPEDEEPVNRAGHTSPYEGDDLNQEATAMRNELTYRGVSQGGGETQAKEMWGADYTTMKLGDKFKRSLLAGVGQVANETGDVIQLAGGLLPGLEITKDNMLSSWLHKVGEGMEDDNVVFNSKELEDWTWSDMGNIEFWATDIAKQMPNLAAFLIPGFGGAQIGRTSLSKAVSYGMRKGLVKGTKAFRATKGMAKGRLIGGSGLAGKLTGETAEKMAGMVGAGLATNIVNSAVIAGDAMNQALEMGLTEEQARYVAAQTYMDNTKYVLADMVSWGISFGKLNPNLLRAANKLGVNRALTFAERIGRAGFRKTGMAMKGGIKGGKILGVAGLEGMEEQFQEVYEEWITKKNIAASQGKQFDDYWTFFNSPEMKKTRGIAMGAGMFGASVPTMINEIAETMRISTNQDELLKRRIEWGKDAAKQKALINDVMANIVLNEQGTEFNSFLSDLVKKGVITEEEKGEYVERGDKFSEMYEQSQLKNMDGSGNLNEHGAHYLFNMMVMEETAREELEEASEKSKAVLAAKLKDVTDEKVKEEITNKHNEEFEETARIITNKMEAAKQMQQNLIAGKVQEGIPEGFKVIGNNLVIDEDSKYWEGTDIAQKAADGEMAAAEIVNEYMKAQKGLSQNQYNKFTKQGAEANVENAESTATEMAKKGKGIVQKGVETFKNFFGKKTKPSEEGGAVVSVEKAKTGKDIAGKTWTDSNGDVYARKDGEWTITDTDGNVQTITESEAIDSFNKIADEQAERTVNEVNGVEPNSASVENRAVKLDKSEALPGSFKVGDKTYTKNDKGGYNTGEKTSVSAAKALSDYNNGVEAGTTTIEQAQEVNQDNILDTFVREFNGYRKNLENQDAGWIRSRLRGLWTSLKKQGKLVGESFPDTEAKVEEMIDKAVEQYKKLPFASNERFEQDAKKRREKLEEGNADIEFEAELYASSANLEAWGGIDKLNAMAANRMPRYNGDNSTYIQMMGAEVNRSVQKKFGKNVSVVLLDNLNQRAGYDAAAMALGSTIFITPNSFAQPVQLFHEVLHVHYALNPKDPAVRSFLSKVSKNKKFVDSIKKRYADQVLYSSKPMEIPVTVGDLNTSVYQKGDVFMTTEGKEIGKSHPMYEALQEAFKPRTTSPFAEGMTSDEFLDQNQWELTELPMEQQEIINEELYTHGMQATVDNNYDIFFQPKDKTLMRNRAKGMWGKFRARVDKKYAAQMLQEEELNDETKTKVLNSLMKMDTEKGVYQTNGVRFAREFSTAQKVEMKNSIEEGKNSYRNYKNDERLGEILNENPDILGDEEIDNGETGGEQVSDDENVTINVNTQNQYAQGKTTSRIINSFLRGWNKNQDIQDESAELISKRDVVVPLRLDSKKFGEEEFVLAQRNSNYKPIAYLIADLDAKFKKKSDGTERTDAEAKALTNATLAAMHKNFSTAVQEQPYQMLVQKGPKGEIIVTHEPLVSKHESALHRSLLTQYNDMAYSYQEHKSQLPGISMLRKDLKDNKKALIDFNNNPRPTAEQTLALLRQLFRTNDLVFEGLINDTMFYNGQTTPFIQAFRQFTSKAVDTKGKFPKLIAAESDSFIRSMIAANRKHTLNDIVMNPENNPTTTYNKQNYIRLKQNRLNKTLESLRNKNPDFRFNPKHRPGRSALRNFWLENGGMQIESFAGIRNRAYDQNQKYSRMNENSFALASILRFVAEGNPDSYMQTLGTASDSNSHYTVRVPKHSFRGPQAGLLAKEVNRVLGEEMFVVREDGTIDHKKGLFSQDLKRSYEYFMANKEDLSKIPQLRLSNDAQNINNKALGDAIFSNIVNKVLLQEELFGADAMKNAKFTKRLKNANSPVIPFRSKTRLDIIPIKVPEIDGIKIADGDSFITIDAAERMKREYGVSININDAGAFKIMSFNDSPNGKGLTQLKTMAFVLTDDYVKDNPMLKGLKQAMEAREKKNADNPNYFAVAATTDAIKQGDVKGSAVDLGNAFTESTKLAQSNEEASNEISSIIESQAEAINDRDGVFEGFDGSNFGIMQEMDLGATRSTLPTQLMANLLTNLDPQDDLFSEVIAIQEKAAEIMSLKMNQEVMNQLKGSGIVKMEDLEKISNYLHKRHKDNENVTDLTKSMSDIKSLNIPYLNNDAYNTIANILSRAGNKIQMAGGYAFQTSELGHVNPVNKEGGVEYNNTLSDGYNGEPADAIIPKHIAEEHGLKDGSLFIASRIPHHGPQTTQVFKVKSVLERRNGSSIIVNSKFTDIIGADHDGDALYFQVRPTDKMFLNSSKHGGQAMLKLHEEMFDMLAKMLQNPKVLEDRMAKMEPTAEGVDKVYSEAEQKQEKENYYNNHHPMTIWGEAKRFNENVPFKSMVGIAAQVHRAGHLLRAYNIDLNEPVRANGRTETGFKNNGQKGKESTAYKSAVMLNIILDNANDQSGSILGITPETVNQYAIMLNMGFSFKDVTTFMKSEGVKAWIEVNGNRSNALLEEKSKTDLVNKAYRLISTKKGMSPQDIEQAKAEIDQMAYLDEVSNELLKVSTILSGHKKLNGDFHVLNKQVNDFHETMRSKKAFKNISKLNDSPEVKRYLKTAGNMLHIHRTTNLAASPEINQAYDAMSNSIGDGFMMGAKGRDVKQNLWRVLASEMAPHKTREYYDGLPVRINDYISRANKAEGKMNGTPFLRMLQPTYKQNLKTRTTELTGIGLSRGLSNPNEVSENEIRYMRWHFARLPEQVQEAVFHYDMLYNGLSGNSSFMPYYNTKYRKMVEKAANRMKLDHTKGNSLSGVGGKIATINSTLHPRVNLSSEGTTNKLYNKQNFRVVSPKPELLEDSRLDRAITENKPHFITVQSTRKAGSKGISEHLVYKYQPLSEQAFEDMKKKAMTGKGAVDGKRLRTLLTGREAGEYVIVGRKGTTDSKNLWLINPPTTPNEGVKKKPQHQPGF